MSWADTALHVGGGALIGAVAVPATLWGHPWAALEVPVIVAIGGLLREQAQFQSDRNTRLNSGVGNWTKWASRDSLIEGFAWGLGALLCHAIALGFALFG